MTEPNDKAALLADRIARAATKANEQAIPARAESAAIRLTPAQESLWFLHNSDPENTAYNVFRCFEFDGIIRSDLVASSLQVVIDRHESLRTVIEDRDGVPIPSIAATARADVQTVQVGKLDGNGSLLTSDVRERCATFVRQPFDLSRPPLVRALILTDTLSSFLVISVHHIACDEWSLDIVLREFSVCYDAQEKGIAPTLQDVTIRFSDYASWLFDKVETLEKCETPPASLAYWADVLTDIDTADYLPLPRSRSEDRGGALVTAELDRATSDRLRVMAKELARAESVSVFSILVAGYAAVLFRYSRMSPVRIGVPVTNRTTAGLDTLVGYLLNTLVLNIEVTGASSFRSLVKHTSQVINEAIANQEVPFDSLVRLYASGRQGTRNPFFDYMFVLLGGASGLTLGPHAGVDVQLYPGTAKFDLTLFASNTPSTSDPIGLMAEYKTDVFSKADVDTLCERYSRILSAATRNPDAAIDNILVDGDRGESGFHGGPPPLNQHSSLSAWVVAAAEATPAAVAATDAATGESLTYLQLCQRAKQLSDLLKAAGLGSHQRVALALDGTLDLIPAVLAIWDCDCAFVPIDTSYPSDYLSLILSSVDPALVLCTRDTEAIPQEYRSRTLVIDASGQADSSADVAAFDACTHDGDLAYVIYTSGSTGVPRGVPITHANILYSTEARHAYYRDDPPGRFLVLSSSAFDSSMAGIWWTVAAGGEAIFMKAEKRRDVEYVSDVIRTRAVTHSLCTPMLYNALLEYPDKLKSLALVIVAGETCSPSLVHKHFANSDAKLFNEYGPTECTVWASVYECNRGEGISPGGVVDDVPIGEPIPGTEFAVIGRDGVALPRGVIGELAIRGRGVSPGYYLEQNLPKFSNDGWYRTGDLGWITSSQTGRPLIHFGGRVDTQVKLNGFRIEPGEIEAILKSHPDVMDVAVVLTGTSQ